MKFSFKKFMALLLILGGCCTEPKPQETVQCAIWDYGWMQEVKRKLESEDQTYRSALEALMKDADAALDAGVYSVTFKKMIPPSGSKHDYMSMGPYWWPDPEKADGLPYIRRDGEVNPERDELDSQQKSKMINSVRALSLAWFFTDKPDYAQKAAELLRVWFLDEATRMNPHLEYAQAIPGITPGRFIGVIDAAAFAQLVDAIALLEPSGALSDNEKAGIQTWFEKYFRWLTESEHGKNEDAYKNNHSVAYDVQAAAIAFFIGDLEFAARKARELPRRRIDSMIEGDGSQPEELIRTKAFSYSVGNLRNFYNVGEIGMKAGVNIFGYKNQKGGSLRTALDYLIQFIGKESDWPYEQIADWDKTENGLGLLVRRAAWIYEDSSYQKLWKEVFYERMKSDWSLLVIPGNE
jgi:hypothetical protein